MKVKRELFPVLSRRVEYDWTGSTLANVRASRYRSQFILEAINARTTTKFHLQESDWSEKQRRGPLTPTEAAAGTFGVYMVMTLTEIVSKS